MYLRKTRSRKLKALSNRNPFQTGNVATGNRFMRNEGFEVTFGVEVEAILAFHESILQAHLDTTCTIVNDLPEVSRRDLCVAQPECTLKEDH